MATRRGNPHLLCDTSESFLWASAPQSVKSGHAPPRVPSPLVSLEQKNLCTVPDHLVLACPPGLEIMGNNPNVATSDITDPYLKVWFPPPPPPSRTSLIHHSSKNAPKPISRGDLLKGEEQSTCHQDEDDGEVENPGLLGHHNPAIAVELIPSREGLPFPLLRGLLLVWGLHWRGAASADLAVLALSHGLGHPEMH